MGSKQTGHAGSAGADREGADLLLSTPVDSAFLDRAQQELETLMLERVTAAYVRRVHAWRPRWMRHGTSFASWRILRVFDSRIYAAAMTALCLAGLVLALQAEPGEHFLENRRQDIALFALAPLVFWFPLRRWAAQVDRYTARRPHSWILGPVARHHARRLVKPARKLPPFVAEYRFAGLEVTYARIRGEIRTVAWKRPLAGWRRTGEHVTLLFKTATAEAPYCLILHAPSVEPGAYLEALGIRECAFPEAG